ncbi:hypothetical protein D3C83_40360 [compost metagenome]
MIVTCAAAERPGSSFATAVIVTVAGEGTAAGAVYMPAAVIVPTAALPPATPDTCHVTDVSNALATVAVNV